MATIGFYADDFEVTNLNGSGLGFFGAAFGSSISVGEYNTTTFITDGNGINQGPQVNNVKYVHPSSGQINGGANILLTSIPNYLATLNIRFTHPSPVQLQNSELRIYDRVNINNDPSGVLCRVAEIVHPSPLQVAGGSGDSTWQNVAGSGSILSLRPSPGYSGLYNNGTSTRPDTRHDIYVVCSSSPSSLGSKLFSAFFSTEYL